MLDTLAQLFLAFSHFPLLFCFTLVGALIIDRRLFLLTGMLIASDIVINVALKGTFKIPLSPTLQKVGYAFPSGHMQLSTAFYCWWAYFISSYIVRSVLVCLLLGIGASLIHFGYHDIPDVLGGGAVGIGLVACFISTLNAYLRLFSTMLLLSMTMLMIYNALVYAVIPSHAKMAFGGLVLCVLLEQIIKHRFFLQNNR